MDFEGSIKSVGLQLAVVVAAPIPFVISLAIVSVALWQIYRWYYDGRINSLEARLALKAEEASTLKNLLARRDDDGANLFVSNRKFVTEPGSDKATTERQSALVKMAKVLRDSEIELTLAKGQFSSRNVPALKASILTASKLFGVVPPFPVPENQDGPLTLWAGVALLRQILPLLEADHIEEAKRISQEMYHVQEKWFANQV